MFSEYSLFADRRNTTGIKELSPKSDSIVTNHWNAPTSSPIGKSPILKENSTPPHILGMFSPSHQTESLLSSLVLSPTESSPRSEFSDDEDFSTMNSPLADYDDFLQSMGGMEDVGNLPYPSNEAAVGWNARSSFQGQGQPVWQNSPPAYSPNPQYQSPVQENFGKLSKAAAPSSTEHPHGEHPSRTLFVRNINSNVEEHEIRELFEAYGPTRSIYSQCKHRGFVMVSFYDIRHAKNAIRNLQGRQLRRRKLDIHYSIPRNNPSEKDQNQGTLVVFNLDPSTTHQELLEIFGAHGEIKEIRETPNKKHHKFIEFYDVREAEQAMKHLNRTEIKGKKIKIEPSRPGGRKSNSPATQLPYQRSENYSMQNSGYSLYSSSYDANSNYNDLSYDSVPNSYSPPSSFNGGMFVAPHSPAQNSLMSQGGLSPSMQVMNSHTSRVLNLPSEAKRIRSRSAVSPACAKNSLKDEENSQFVLDVNEILSGVEQRTTLMIRNIPNKYTQKMLLAAIDEVSCGLYDFFYLPIDFKNKCNVGYAFINFIYPLSIVQFYRRFHQQKWERFNSEKVCKISFARIQGKESLVLRFQNSSLMAEDEKCRPIIFYSNGPKMGQQEPFPVGSNVVGRYQEDHSSYINPSANIQVPQSYADPTRISRMRSLSCKQ